MSLSEACEAVGYDVTQGNGKWRPEGPDVLSLCVTALSKVAERFPKFAGQQLYGGMDIDYLATGDTLPFRRVYIQVNVDAGTWAL